MGALRRVAGTAAAGARPPVVPTRPGGGPRAARPSAPRSPPPGAASPVAPRRVVPRPPALRLAALAAAAAALALACALPNPLAAAPGPGLDEAPRGDPGCPASFRPEGHPGLVLRVDKAHLRLAAYRDGAPVPDAEGRWCWPVALGASPEGDKHAQGDERTPEGWLRVTHRNPTSSFHLSLGLNYPAERHALAAFAEGRITEAERDRIVRADRARRPAPGDTPLGGDIYIHGGGALVPWWTDGCVAVDDAVIEHLYAIAGPGTEVLVLP